MNLILPATKLKRAQLIREAMLKTTIKGLSHLSAGDQGKLALLIIKALENGEKA